MGENSFYRNISSFFIHEAKSLQRKILYYLRHQFSIVNKKNENKASSDSSLLVLWFHVS